MAGEYVKRDRTARLLRVEHLLYQHPDGLTAAEVAGRVGVNVRTAYRDLRALQDEVDCPIWEEKGRFGALPSAFLPALKLTLLEAVTLFESARLMARFSDRRDENVIRAFGSLASILPSPIAQHVYATVAALNDGPRDERSGRVFEALVTGWATGRQVRITYAHRNGAGELITSERIVAPYFIEPHPGGHSSYALAHDSASGAMRTFKMDRVQSATLTDERFEIPASFDARERLRDSWIVTDEEPVEVRLLFHEPSAAERARENHWHTSQREVVHGDGKVELRFTIAGLLEIQSWVLGWGESVEVLAPAELRANVASTARKMAARYA